MRRTLKRADTDAKPSYTRLKSKSLFYYIFFLDFRPPSPRENGSGIAHQSWRWRLGGVGGARLRLLHLRRVDGKAVLWLASVHGKQKLRLPHGEVVGDWRWRLEE